MSHITVAVSEIVANPVKLRDVDVESVPFQELVEDIKIRGIMHSPSVRIVDVDGVPQYQLIDGLHRFTAAQHAGLETITVNVIEADDSEVIVTQIAMNAHTVETKPMAFTKAMQHLLTLNPLWTIGDLSKKIGKSHSFIKVRLELLKRVSNEKIHSLIDDDSISLANAFLLAKLPADEQMNYLTAAQTEGSAEFHEKVAARLKELTDAARQGRQPKPTEFVPVPIMRKFQELKTAAEDETVVARLASQASSVEDAVRVALQYVVRLDPISVEEQRQAWEAKKAAEAKAKEDAKAKREAAAAAKTAEANEKAGSLL